MAKITILSPVAKAAEAADGAGPGIGSLQGLRIGMRTDWIWPVFEHVVEVWKGELEAGGATVVTYKAQNHTGPGSEGSDALFEQFVNDVDLVVVGLGN